VRALFFGTPQIAVPALEALVEIADVVGVVCQPDRPAGRGMKLRAPPVKLRAEQLGLEVLQPTKVRTADFAAWVAQRDATVALVIAYGRILPEAVLRAAERGCMNLHASLLPRLRGASPISWAIVRGETETGVSLMQMDAGMDSGPVYTRHRIAIDPEETAGELSERLGQLAAQVVRADLVAAVAGKLLAEPQDPSQASHAPPMRKDQGRIDWTQSAQAVHDHVRGMNPWPGAFAQLRGRAVKILRTRVHVGQPQGAEAGTVIIADTGGLFVATGSGVLQVQTLQFEGRKALGAREVIAGRSVRAGEVFEGPDPLSGGSNQTDG
jgi:methionyl-tRNA formyltransferase